MKGLFPEARTGWRQAPRGSAHPSWARVGSAHHFRPEGQGKRWVTALPGFLGVSTRSGSSEQRALAEKLGSRMIGEQPSGHHQDREHRPPSRHPRILTPPPSHPGDCRSPAGVPNLQAPSPRPRRSFPCVPGRAISLWRGRRAGHEQP